MLYAVWYKDIDGKWWLYNDGMTYSDAHDMLRIIKRLYKYTIVEVFKTGIDPNVVEA